MGFRLNGAPCFAPRTVCRTPCQTFVEAGVLKAIVGVMDRFRQEWHLQMYSCEAISATTAALPGSNPQLLAHVLEVGAQRAVGRALQW